MDVNDTEDSHVLMPADVVGTEYHPLLNAGSEGKAFLNFTYHKVCDGSVIPLIAVGLVIGNR